MSQINLPLLYLNFKTMEEKTKNSLIRVKSFLWLIKAKLEDFIYICQQWAFWYTSRRYDWIFKTSGMQEQNNYPLWAGLLPRRWKEKWPGLLYQPGWAKRISSPYTFLVQAALGMCFTCNSLPDSSWWRSQYVDCWGSWGVGEEGLVNHTGWRLVTRSDTHWFFPHCIEKNKPYGQMTPN